MGPASAEIVLFLGAGATAPLGKLVMGPFVEKLKSHDRIGRSLLFLEIADKKLDLEFLLEELYDLETKGYITVDTTAFASPGHTPAQVAGLRNQKSNLLQRVAQTAKELREAIEQQVFYAYRNFDDPAQVGPHFSPLFKLISESLPSGQSLEAFTTNYDQGVELFCAQNQAGFLLHDGFSLNPLSGQLEWDGTAFDTASSGSTTSSRRVFLSKLHGSTNWFRHNAAIIKGLGVLTPSDPLYTNLLIYPAQTKVAVDEPFFTSYCRLQQCLETTQVLVSVGYSFRDQDALTRLMAAQRVNPGLKIIVFDPLAKVIVDRLHGRGLTNLTDISGGYDPMTADFPALMSQLRKELPHR